MYSTPEEEEEWSKNFEFFFESSQKPNVITYKELGPIMRALDKPLSNSELKQMINEIGNNDQIDFKQFMSLMLKKTKINEEDDYIDCFKVFDRDGNGLITTDELKLVLGSLGEKLSDDEIEMMIQKADRSGNNAVNYQDFVKMMINK